MTQPLRVDISAMHTAYFVEPRVLGVFHQMYTASDIPHILAHLGV